ncbi:hypothetical protein KR032_007512, partial [Drosophila birchii]
IGIGFYGRVFKAQWQGKTIALKQIAVGKADKQIEREVTQLSKLEHPNIVRLYGCSNHQHMFHLLVEYADGGSLSTLIHSDYPSYTLAHALNWAHQIAQGLAYLHAMKPKAVIHRDIKPNNAVLSQHALSLKICDFGTVVDLTTSMTAEVGTCLYKAPEVSSLYSDICRFFIHKSVIIVQVFKGRKYDEKCDVYSWAITFWEILARKQPFEQCKFPASVSMAVTGGVRPLFNNDMALRDCPEDIINLITACWDPESSRRYSMKFVANMTNEALKDAGPVEPLLYII